MPSFQVRNIHIKLIFLYMYKRCFISFYFISYNRSLSKIFFFTLLFHRSYVVFVCVYVFLFIFLQSLSLSLSLFKLFWLFNVHSLCWCFVCMWFELSNSFSLILNFLNCVIDICSVVTSMLHTVRLLTINIWIDWIEKQILIKFNSFSVCVYIFAWL